MSTPVSWFIPPLSLALVVAAAGAGHSQADPNHFRFSRGQTVQPYFEGWSPNPDGSFEMHFGYLNRNFVEELHVEVGPDNQLTPGVADQGQPTFFYPHRSNRAFSVTVPPDWGDRKLVWAVTVRDETNRAVAWLQPEWEIFADPSRRDDGLEGGPANKPPTLRIDAASSVALGETLTMTAVVTDDGLPKPRPRRSSGVGALPTFEPDPEGTIKPVNVPELLPENRKIPTRTQVEQVNVTWTQWRGPTGVSMKPRDESENGATTVDVTFESAGDYVFRVSAADRDETVTEGVAVRVR